MVIKDPNYEEPARDPTRIGPHKVAEVVPLEGQLKEGHIDGFTVMCDEALRPEGRGGGTGTAPSPLAYFTIGIGF